MYQIGKDKLRHTILASDTRYFCMALSLSMKEIKLTKGYVATIDDQDFEMVSMYKWRASIMKNRAAIYAVTQVKRDGGRKQISMHRLILGLTDKRILTDHVDTNGLNNQRSNLRECTHAENNRNVGLSKNNTTGYKGVIFDKRRSKWYARIRFNYRTIVSRGFDSPEDAARQYDKKALELHGNFASLNFPQCLQKE